MGEQLIKPRTANGQNGRMPVKEIDIMKFSILLEPTEEGGFNVSVPALDGCFTQGDTEELAMENAKEAIQTYLEGLEKLNQIKSTPDVILKVVEMTF